MRTGPLYLAIALASVIGVAQFGVANAQSAPTQDQAPVQSPSESQAQYDQSMRDYHAQQAEHADATAEYQAKQDKYEAERGAYDVQRARYERARMRYDHRWGVGAYERRYGVYHRRDHDEHGDHN